MSSNYEGMPRWVKVSLIIVVALILLLVGLKGLGIGGEHGPGRHAPFGGGAEATHGGSDGDPSQACSAQKLDHGGGTGAQMTCEDAEGAGQNAQAFPCQNPGHGGLEAEWDLDAGNVTVTVRDASGAAVYTRTFSGQGSDSASFAGAQAGSWEVEAERGDGFAGSFTVQTFCAS